MTCHVPSRVGISIPGDTTPSLAVALFHCPLHLGFAFVADVVLALVLPGIEFAMALATEFAGTVFRHIQQQQILVRSL